MEDCGHESFKMGIASIFPHPRNTEIYGEDDVQSLAEKIKNSGYVKPLYVAASNVVNGENQYRIISGHRRYRACLKLGYTQIPVVVKKFENEKDELEILLLENMYRDKTVEQKVKEAEVWEEIEKEKARERQSKLNGRTMLVEKFPQAEQGKTRDIVAKRVGIGSGKTLETAKEVVKKINELKEKGDTENAEFLSKALDKSVSGAKKLAEENVIEEVPKIYKDLVNKGSISVNEAVSVAKTAVETKKKNEENERLFQEQLKKEQQEREEKQRIEEQQKNLPENTVVLDKFRKPEETHIFGITDFNDLTDEQFDKCLKHCKKYQDTIYKVAILWDTLDSLMAWSCILETQDEINMELETINDAIQVLCKIQSYFKEVKRK